MEKSLLRGLKTYGIVRGEKMLYGGIVIYCKERYATAVRN